MIKKVLIKNYKKFNKEFIIDFNKDVNIIVGNNEAGKSTVLEAINIAFTGIYDGRYINNEITQYLFNNHVVKNYIESVNKNEVSDLPSILIEVYLESEEIPEFIGNGNSLRENTSGFKFEILFDERFKEEYEMFVNEEEVKSLPVEYYTVNWASFGRISITPRAIKLKTAFIDSASSKYRYGSDVYISRIIKNNLEPGELIDISQAHRKLRDDFKEDSSVKKINNKLNDEEMDRNIEISVELLSSNAWETSLTTYIDEVPFRHIGKGDQCMIKSFLALKSKKSQNAGVILIEEPENHLSYSKLNQLLDMIDKNRDEKQLIISTHSSFVANKLGLDNLSLLNKNNITKFSELSEETKNFFEKISGYDTLRLILSKKSILVEGASDELIVQKAYMIKNDKLPIHDGIDVISVGTSFLRFLEISEKLEKNISVVTDSDGDIEALENKYEKYLGTNQKKHINIYYDEMIDSGELELSNKKFNYNTLEPKIVKANSLSIMNKILDTGYEDINNLHKFMYRNKTKCALKIFNADLNEIEFQFPDYILKAIE